MVPWSNKKTFFTLQCTEVICVTDKSYKNSFERYVASLSQRDRGKSKNKSNVGLALIASDPRIKMTQVGRSTETAHGYKYSA